MYKEHLPPDGVLALTVPRPIFPPTLIIPPLAIEMVPMVPSPPTLPLPHHRWLPTVNVPPSFVTIPVAPAPTNRTLVTFTSPPALMVSRPTTLAPPGALPLLPRSEEHTS